MAEPVPGPRGYPLIGNMFDIDQVEQLSSLLRLAEIYGPIFKLMLNGEETYIVTGYELYNELCDEKRFRKVISGSLKQVRVGLGDALFTAWSDEPAWGIAHRALVPVFGPLAIHNMFDEMHDISTQMILKWARVGPECPIDPTDDFTRLTLDTITLCAMETRFNSFYTETRHPFLQAMSGFLIESGKRSVRPAIVQRFMKDADKELFANIKLMKDIAGDIVTKARANPSSKKNILNAMLSRADPKTGLKMTDENIMYNMMTFLIAGHETTAGFLSFITYHLCANPDVLRKAQQEVDEVVGDGVVKSEHTGKVPYITAIMREAMRVTPTISWSNIGPVADAPEQVSLLGGKYIIPKHAVFRTLGRGIMRDPAVWGEDADVFKPERCLDENFSKMPKNAWKPFGNGERSCIGQAFAWQEATMALLMILQNFDLKFVDPAYQLRIKQTLTVKPDGLRIFAVPRKGVNVDTLEAKITGGGQVSKPKGADAAAGEKAESKRPLAVFWGGNSGTSESLAQMFEKTAGAHGYQAEIAELDSATHALPQDKPVVIITASYEGEPPDNARRFVDYIQELKENELKGVRYAVFGNGNHDWARTYQRIPTLCDDVLKSAGATQLAPRGAVDVGAEDVFNTFETWAQEFFWPAVIKEFGGNDAGSSAADELLDAEISTGLRPSHMKQSVQEAVVIENKVTGTPSGPAQKRHIELQLPSGMEYRAGDYLAVLPLNHQETIKRVMRRFDLPFDAFINVKSKNTTLPNTGPVSVHDILSAYVELNQPATRRNVARLATSAHDEKDRSSLEELTKDSDLFNKEITTKRTSLLDLLERYPSVSLTFVEYLSLLPQLRLRQYSISSSPLANPGHCTLTVGVLDSPALSDKAKRFYGVASNYLARLEPNDRVQVAVKQSHASFHLPTSNSSTPIIMAASGTGIAPFRGFIQERAAQKAGGRTLAPAVLFYGVQDESQILYKDELEQWQHADGIVDVRYAFSREPTNAKAAGSKYVQDRFWTDREEVRRLFKDGAKVYICGSGRIGEGLKWKSIDVAKEGRGLRGEDFTQDDAVKWFDDLRNDRYMADVFD